MRKALIAAAALSVAAALSPVAALARPSYKPVFLKAYEAKPGSNLEKASCGVCHAGPDKTIRNAYGVDMLKAMGKPKVSDEEALAAIKKIENNLSADKKTKYIELIKQDKVPAEPKPAEAKPAG